MTDFISNRNLRSRIGKYILTDDMKSILGSLPRNSNFVFPKAQVRVSPNCPSKTRNPSGVAQCCNCPLKRDRFECNYRKTNYTRVKSIKTAWTNIRKKANALHLTIHDLRRYNNDKLLESGLTNNESGALIGNSERVNALHYDVRREARLSKIASEKRLEIGRIAPSVVST